MPIDEELRNQPPRVIIGREHENFDPWLTFRMAYRTMAVAVLLLGIGVVLQYVISGRIGLPSYAESIKNPNATFALIPLAFGALLFTIFFLFFISGLAGALLDIKNDGFLVRYGVPIEATVTKIGYGGDWYFNTPKIVYYSFTAANGREYSGKWESRCDSKIFWDAEEGSTLTVLYSPKNPKHHLPYEAAIYKAVS